MASTKDTILEHLRYNRGREIPVSEIAEKYNFSYSRISNAIKDLKYKDEIEIEHRPLKKGKYTLIRLKGDQIIDKFVHEREIEIPDVYKEKNISEKSPSVEDKSTLLDNKNINMFINYLKSNDFSSSSFNKMLEIFKYKTNFELITKIIQPIQHEVGKRWIEGKISIADEHLITANIEKFIIQEIPLNNSNSKKVIVLSPIEGEWHTLSLISLELFLSEKGFKVFNLARPLPNSSLINFVSSLDFYPSWLFISLTLDTYLGTLRHLLNELREKFADKIKIAIGGQGINSNIRNSFPEANIVVTNNKELEEFLKNL